MEDIRKSAISGSTATASAAGAQDTKAQAPRMGRAFLLMLIAVSAVSPLGINLYLPSMPRMSASLGVDYAAIQLTLSMYLAAVAFGQLFVGPISDHYGRRPVLVVGLAMFVVGSVICMLAPSIGVLHLGRVIQAIGGCAGIALSRAIVRDLYDRAQAASMIGYVTMGMAVAPMVAPTIGGLLEAAHGWRASFAFLAVFGFITLVVIYRMLQETNPWRRNTGAPAQPLLAGYAALFRIPAFWGFALTAGFTSSAFFSFAAGASYVVINLMGRTPVEYGMYFGLVSLGYLIGNFFSGRFAQKMGPQRLIYLGSMLSIAAVIVMSSLYSFNDMSPAVLFVPMMFVGLGNGMILPSCFAGAVSVKPEVAGAASGLAGSIQIGFGAIAAPVVGALLDTTAWPMLIITGIASVMALITIRVFTR